MKPTDSNVAQWLSLLRVITDEVAQSRLLGARISEEVMSPKSHCATSPRECRCRGTRCGETR
ncbi:MAG: hypothetical protein IJO90_00415, partial [Alistipes sp.]|nr:hypothetical protein [Alistipes sp.]